MANKKKLKNYLLKENAFLLDEKNNGKTIMLSGVWGAGKTYFWKEEIEREQKKILKDGREEDKYTEKEYKKGLYFQLKDKEKACVYVSLYGKTSIESIELDVYMKAYQNIVGNADFVSKTCSVFTNLGKNLGNMAHRGAGGTFSWIESLIDKDKFDKAGKYLENGGVICFDDFERKSKEIDLNDLFGFISQLALEYKCKVVIILNSEVFIDQDAKVFQNVKEKSINKFLKFNPSKEELFKIIFSLYTINKKYKNILLNSIVEVDILNARIYQNIFENFEELIKKYPKLTDNEIRFFVLSIINFNLIHKTFKFYDYPKGLKNWKLPLYFLTLKKASVKMLKSLETLSEGDSKSFNIELNLRSNLKSWIESGYKTIEEPNKKTEHKATEGLNEDLEVLNEYFDDIWAFWRLERILNFRENVSIEKQQIINDFIENGYL